MTGSVRAATPAQGLAQGRARVKPEARKGSDSFADIVERSAQGKPAAAQGFGCTGQLYRRPTGALRELYKSSEEALQELYKSLTGASQELYRSPTGALHTGVLQELYRGRDGRGQRGGRRKEGRSGGGGREEDQV